MRPVLESLAALLTMGGMESDDLDFSAMKPPALSTPTQMEEHPNGPQSLEEADPPEAEAEVDLTRVAASSGFRRDDIIDVLVQTQKNVTKALAMESSRKRILELEKENRGAITQSLRELAKSPLISQDTQAAFLKTVMVDYLAAQDSGDPESGPSLRDVLTAAKMLSETCGLNEPKKIDVNHDISLKLFPVAQAPFTGELPELEIKDAVVTPV